MKGFIPILLCTIGVVTAGVLDNIGSLSTKEEERDARSTEKIGAQRISEMSHEDLVRQKFILDILQHINEPNVSEELLQQISNGAEDQLIDDQSMCSGTTSDDDALNYVIALSRSQQLLGKNEVFSLANDDHVRQMIGLYRLLVCCRNWETLQKNLIYARKHVNGILLVNSLLMAIRDREDTQNLIVPGIHEILPEIYLDEDLIRRAQNINLNQLTSRTQSNTKTTLTEPHHPGLLEMIGLNKLLHLKNSNNVGVQSLDRRELWMPWREMRMEVMSRKMGKAPALVSIRDDDRIVLPVTTQSQGGGLGDDSSGLKLLTEDVGFQSFLQTFLNDLCLNEKDLRQTNGDTFNRVGSLEQGGVRGQTTMNGEGLSIDTDKDRMLPVGHRRPWTQTNRNTLTNLDNIDDSEDLWQTRNGQQMLPAQNKAGLTRIGLDRNVGSMLQGGFHRQTAVNAQGLNTDTDNERLLPVEHQSLSEINPKIYQKYSLNGNTWPSSQGDKFEGAELAKNTANDEDLLYLNQRKQYGTDVNQISSRSEQQNTNYIKDNEDWTRGQLSQNPTNMNMRTRFLHTIQTRDVEGSDNGDEKKFDWNTNLLMGMPMDWNRQMAMHRLRAKSDEGRLGMGTRDSMYTGGNQQLYQKGKDLPEVDINDERLLYVSSRKRNPLTWSQREGAQVQHAGFDERLGAWDKNERWTDDGFIGNGQHKNQNWINSNQCIGGRCDAINKERTLKMAEARGMNNIGIHDEQEMGGRWGTKSRDDVGRPWATMSSERGRQITKWDNEDDRDIRGGDERRPTLNWMNSKQCIGGHCDTFNDKHTWPTTEMRGIGNNGIHEGQGTGGRWNVESRDDVGRPWTTKSSERGRQSISSNQCIGGSCDTFNDKRTWPTTAVRGMGNMGVHEGKEMGGHWGVKSRDDVGRPWTTMSSERGRQSRNWDSDEDVDVRGDDLLNEKVRRPTQNWMNSKQCIGGRCDTFNDKRTWPTTEMRGMGNIGVHEGQEMVGRWGAKSRYDDDSRWTPVHINGPRQSINWDNENDLDVRDVGSGIEEDNSIWLSRSRRSIRNSVNSGSQRGIALDRAGELTLHNLQQLVARINLEKISLGAASNDELELQDDIIPSRVNNPRLINSAEERYAVRLNDMRLKTRRNRDLLDKINELEKRLEVIIKKEILLQIGGKQARDRRIPVKVERIIGNVLMGKSSNSDSSLNIMHVLREIILQSKDIRGVNIQKLSQAALDVKDPIVLYLLRRIVGIADQQRKQAFGDYLREDIQMQGVTINGVTVDKLCTFVDTNDIDLVNALNTREMINKDQRMVVARLERLNHKDFNVNLDVTSDRDQRVVVRTLLGPKVDTTILSDELNEQRRNFILLDAQVVQLHSGRNQVKTKSREIKWTARDTTPLSVIYKRVMQALNGAEGDNIISGDRMQGQTCRFPHRLLLPRGRVEGLPMQMLVVITPVMEEEDGTTQQWGLNQSICGIGMGSVNMDGLPLGFPLDRPVQNVRQFIALPNVHLMDVQIYHDQQVKAHDWMNDLSI